MKKLKIFIVICLILCIVPLIINLSVILSTAKKINSVDDNTEEFTYALVLGCSVLNNETPSKMLKDRLDAVISLYNKEVVKKIIVSGDERENYSEVKVMHDYLIINGVKNSDITIDNKGYSTGESLENYANNYSEKVLIISQKYHLYRALYIASRLNIEAYGVHAKIKHYPGNFNREVREILARNKDFLKYLYQ